VVLLLRYLLMVLKLWWYSGGINVSVFIGRCSRLVDLGRTRKLMVGYIWLLRRGHAPVLLDMTWVMISCRHILDITATSSRRVPICSTVATTRVGRG